MNLHAVRIFVLGIVMAAAAPLARASTIEVQAVTATDPGKKPGECPSSLLRYKTALMSSAYGAFADAGMQSIQLTAAAPMAQAPLGAYTLELTLQGPGKVNVVVKEGAKPITTPATYMFVKGKPKQIELTGGKHTTIVFLTLEKE